KKPFKLVSQDRRIKKGVVAGNMEELMQKGITRTLFNLGSENIQIVLEEDGTEVLEDEYLLFLDNNTKLMILPSNNQWNP
ncbi:hypothetical protein DAPPUDRAFT_16993, partial [Daphnia pulex]